MTPIQPSHCSDADLGSAKQASFAPLPKAIFRDLMRSGCVSLYGPHRSGKTRLALELTRLWEQKGGIVRHLDLRQCCTVAETIEAGESTAPGGIMGACQHALLIRLGQDPATPVQDQRFQQRLSDLIQQQPSRILLVLDHWAALPGDIAHELLVALRAALQEQASSDRGAPGRVHLLLVSARDIGETEQGATSPFLNIATPHWLPDLSQDVACDLLSQSLQKQGYEIDPTAVDWLVTHMGGDRDLIARARAYLIADCRDSGTTPIDLKQTQRIAETMLARALDRTPDWPLASELVAGLVSHRMLLDVMSDLLAGRQTNLREIRRDTGTVEASGFVRRIGIDYRFRTPFHEALARRLLTPRTWGDLAVLHHDWPRARDHYRAQPVTSPAKAGSFAPHDLGMALATCLLRMDSTDEILLGLAEMLALSIRVKDVHILTVHGQDPRDFQPLTALPPSPPDLLSQIEECVRLHEPRVSRVANGQRWVRPLVVQGADRMPYTHAAVLFTSTADWPGPALDEAKRLCLFAQQLLGERLDAERDRSFAEITRSIDEAEGLQAVLQRMATAALDLTAASFSSIKYPDGDGLSTAAVQASSETLEKHIHYQPVGPGVPNRGVTVTSYVHTTGKPLIVGHREVETFQDFQMLEGMAGALAEAAVPIRLKGQAYGVINVESEVPYFFAERHIAVLERLAALAGIAISAANRLDRAEHDAILARVFGGIAHEAKNHSTIIAMRTGLMERQLNKGQCDPDKVQEGLRVIGHHAEAIGLMVDDFRWLAKPQLGEVAPEVSLQTVIKEALDRLSDRLDPELKDRLKWPVVDLVAIEATQDLPLAVRGRSGLLRRVIENLLQNAWEAVVEHKEPEAYDVAVRLFAEGQRMTVIEVLDRGPGVVNNEEIFQPYYTTKGAKGLGLGLVIAKQVIEAHQGSIRALQRNDGTGTCFRIELPRATTAPGSSLEISEDAGT